jgi:hypothetical protein
LLTEEQQRHSLAFSNLPIKRKDSVNGNEKYLSKTQLLFVIFFCTLFFSAVAWLVNLEIALQVIFPDLSLVDYLVPALLYDWFAWFSADLSSISTLVPVLLALFPCMQCWRVLKAGNDELARRKIASDPYPDNFSYFLVMLGLAGTLYGLFIGLDVSGVKELGDKDQQVDKINESLDQLLGGTATALLSSLLGLIGAFLAAKPLTWIFQWATELAEEEELGLSETIERLVGDMQKLGDASRAFGERLEGSNLQDMPATLAEIRTELAGLRQELADANQRIAVLGESQREGQAMLAPLNELGRLGNLEILLSRIGDAHEAGNETENKMLSYLYSMHQNQLEEATKTKEEFSAMASCLRAIEEHIISLKQSGVSGTEKLEGMVNLLKTAEVDRKAERNALRSAFGQFAMSNDPEGEEENK